MLAVSEAFEYAKAERGCDLKARRSKQQFEFSNADAMDATAYNVEEIRELVEFIVGNTFVTNGGQCYQQVLSAIGFISDSELGEQYLGEVFEGQGVRAPTAALILLTYYLFLPTGLAPAAETLRKAKAILDRTNAQYPGNSYFWGYSNFYHRKCGEAEEAAAAVEKAISHAGQTGAPPLLLRYMRADTLYMNMDWRKAANAYEGLWGEISEQNIAFEYSGQLVCTLSGALVMAGDVAKARELMERVPAATNPKSKQDAYFPKFAQRCGAEPKLIHLAGLQGLYVNRDLSSMKPESMEQLERYLDQAENAHDFSSSPEVEALALLFRGVLQYGTGRVLNARASWKKIIELGDAKKLGGESPTLPFSYYELGELEFREGNLDQAKKYFDTGVKLKGEKNDTLMNRYNRAIAHLKKALQEHEEKPAAVSSGGLEAAVPAAN
ncbi:tetratricopeptide repeat domain 39B [Diplonema papillatum]|nr:tetratricopeptide repeat domain 39B [Diplonema papillatum]